MSKKPILISGAVTLLLGITFGISSYSSDSQAGELNEPKYQALEETIDIKMPGIYDDHFKDRVTSYCGSERTTDFTQTAFTIAGKSLSYHAAETLKLLLDRSEACA